MRFEVKAALLLGLLLGLPAGWLLPSLFSRIKQQSAPSMDLPATVFYPLLFSGVSVLGWMQLRQAREDYRQAVARGKGASYVKTTLLTVLIIGALGYWFITS